MPDKEGAMNRERATDTETSTRSSITAHLVEEAERMVSEEGSDFDGQQTDEAALSSEEASRDETVSETSVADSTTPPKEAAATKTAAKQVKTDQDQISTAQSELNATLAQVAQMQAAYQQERARAEQLEKDRREAQSYGDRRRNEMDTELDQSKAQIAELTRQLQAVSTRQASQPEDDDDYFATGSRERPNAAPDPVLAELRQQNQQLMARIDRMEQAQIAGSTIAQEQARERQVQVFLRDKALKASNDIFGQPIDALRDPQVEVVRSILTCYAHGNTELAQEVWRNALKNEAAQRTASVRDRSARSRVISEAGMSGTTDDMDLDDESMDPQKVFKDLDFEFRDMTGPVARSKMRAQLIKSAERMAKGSA